MRAGDESFEQLRRAIEELAGGDGAELVAEARIEARARVRSMLTEAMAQAMLERAREELDQDRVPGAGANRQHATPAATRPSAPPTRATAAAPATEPMSALGWYVYGVVGADITPPSDQLPGVDPDHAVTTLRHGTLAAVVSQVPLEEFGEESLRERLADMAWLERTARRHEEVLDTVREHATLIPMRLCSIYRTADGVKEMLEREAEAFEEALARLQGKSEWGVKVFAADSEVDQAADPKPVATEDHEGAGAAYMQRRSAERERRKQLDREIEEACERIHERLRAVTVDGLTSAPQRPEVADHAGQMVLNGVYLVQDDEQALFHRELRALQMEYAALGLELEPTGPWPAYNFIAGTIGAAW